MKPNPIVASSLSLPWDNGYISGSELTNVELYIRLKKSTSAGKTSPRFHTRVGWRTILQARGESRSFDYYVSEGEPSKAAHLRINCIGDWNRRWSRVLARGHAMSKNIVLPLLLSETHLDERMRLVSESAKRHDFRKPRRRRKARPPLVFKISGVLQRLAIPFRSMIYDLKHARRVPRTNYY